MIFEQVKKLCDEKGVSVARVERECNLGNATIRGWDKSMPQADTLKTVADYFGVPMEYFFDESEVE